MVEHIKELAIIVRQFYLDIRNMSQEETPENAAKIEEKRDLLADVLQGFTEELDKLDSIEFEPEARRDFVMFRSNIRALNKPNRVWPNDAATTVGAMYEVLDSYIGLRGAAIRHDFLFIANAEIRKIVERDYRELALRSFPDGAWKSTVILAGGILEGVLYDQLTKDQAAIDAAMNCHAAPRKKNGVVKDITQSGWNDEWKLNDLIRVAALIPIIHSEDEKMIDRVLRQYRNFVHPRVEIETKVTITEGRATAAKGALDVILEGFQ